MSTVAANILADSDGTGKIVAAVVLLFIWGIGALIKVASKQSEESKRRREQLNWEMAEQMRQAAMQREQARMQQPPPRLPQGVPVPVMQRPQGRPAQQQQRRQQARRPGPPPIPRQQQQRKASRRPSQVLEEIPVAEAVDAPIVEITSQGPSSPSRRQAGPAISAARIAKLTPQVLRQQFVLTEIVAPPLALRKDVAGGHHPA